MVTTRSKIDVDVIFEIMRKSKSLTSVSILNAKIAMSETCRYVS